MNAPPEPPPSSDPRPTKGGRRHRIIEAHLPRFAVVLLIASVAFIGVMTLQPTPEARTTSGCIICGSLGGVDFLLNVVLFVPLGVALALKGTTTVRAAFFGLLLSLVVELLQLRIIAGRDASIGDLLSNTMGAALGAWLAPWVGRWVRSRGNDALRYGRFAGVLASLLIGVSAPLLVPASPRVPQWVLWNSRRPGLDSFPALLESASVNGEPVAGGDNIPPRVLSESDFRLTAVAVGHHGITSRRSHIVASANAIDEFFFLGQHGDALVFRTFQRGSILRLRPLMTRLDAAFDTSTQAADVLLEARSDSKSVFLSRLRAGERVEATMPRTAGLAWTLLLPWYIAIDRSWWVANAIFLGALVAPAAFFATRSANGLPAGAYAPSRAWWPVALVVVTTILVTVGAGLSPLGGGEWAGMGLGTLAGAVVARLTSRGHE